MAERTTVTVFKVGTNSGNAASWTSYLDDVSLNRIRNEIDAKTLASPQAVLMSDESTDIPVGGPYTNASDAILGPMFAAPDTARYIEIGPIGSSTGDPKYTTSYAYLADYKIALPANGIAKWSGTFRVVGGMTRGTYS